MLREPGDVATSGKGKDDRDEEKGSVNNSSKSETKMRLMCRREEKRTAASGAHGVIEDTVCRNTEEDFSGG